MRILMVLALALMFLPGKSQVIESNKPYNEDMSSLDSAEINRIALADSFEAKIPIFEVDPCMYDVLNEIIDAEKGCHSFIEGESCFYVFIADKISYYYIYFASSYLKYEDLSTCSGIFEFQNIKFICHGPCISGLLHPSDLPPVFIKYPIDKMLLFYDVSSEWVYVYDNVKFTLGKARLCK